jgi:RuvB-like protein 2
VEKADIRSVYSLFQDVERSVAFLQKYQQQFLYDERGMEEAEAAAVAAAAGAALGSGAAAAADAPTTAMDDDEDDDL